MAIGLGMGVYDYYVYFTKEDVNFLELVTTFPGGLRELVTPG